MSYSIGFLAGAAAVLAVWFGCAYQRKHDLARYFAALDRARKAPPPPDSWWKEDMSGLRGRINDAYGQAWQDQ